MDNSKKWRYTLPDGRRANFSGRRFKEALFRFRERAAASGRRMNLDELYEGIAEAIAVSPSAVKHWVQGHNSPSDPEKAEALAVYLGVSPEELLIFENDKEEPEMNNTTEINNTRTLEPVSFASSKDAVKNIYAAMVGFIEIYRSGVYMQSDNTERLKAYFIPLYMNLMLSRLDIPQKTYKELCSFAENYLQQMIAFRKFSNDPQDYYGDVDSVEENWDDFDFYINVYPGFDRYAPMNPDAEDFRLFRSKIIWGDPPEEELPEMSDICDGDDGFVSAAYDRLSAILADYMEV